MIVGVGIDACGIARFEQTLERTPGIRDRLFAPAERDLPVHSLAGRFAVKEALAKALSSPGGLSWTDAWVPATNGRPPQLSVTGTVAARMAELGVSRLHVSLSHDAGLAVAVVIAEAGPAAHDIPERERGGSRR